MKRPLILAVAALCAAFMLTSSSFALVRHLGTRDMATKAKLIFVGQVDSTECYMDNGTIRTRVTVTPKSFIKGSAKSKVVFSVPGGTIGTKTLQVEDVPTFTPGQQVFLYLNNEKMPVVGCYQGALNIKNNKIDGTKQSLYDYADGVRKVVKETTPQAASEAILASKESIPEPVHLVYGGKIRTEPEPRTAKTRSILAAGDPVWETIMSDSFDGDFPGTTWNLDGDPTFGKNSVNAFSPYSSIWCAGSSDRDPMSDGYRINMNAWAVYGPFDLTNAEAARLTFMYSCQTDGLDHFYWVASSNGKDFDGFGMTGGDGTWREMTMDLSQYCGLSKVYIGFNFSSDEEYYNLAGAFVDDVVLEKMGGTPPPTDAPVITSIQPGKTSSGTHTPVAITGLNFGARNSTSKVDFFFQSRDGVTYPIETTNIISWTNTQIVCEVPAHPTLCYTGDMYYGGAASGPVTVTTSAGTSNPYEFDVSFSYGDAKWQIRPPVVKYRISSNFPANSAIQAAAASWSNCGSLFSFLYDGTFAGESTHQQPPATIVNEISWGKCDNSDVIAQNETVFDTTTHEVYEADIKFNQDMPFSTDGSPDKFDFQTIATHELGHSLRLLDLYGDRDANKVMYGWGDYGEVKRSLSDDDIAGAKWIYQSGSIGQMKRDGGVATLYAKPVTAAFNGNFYIEEPNRSAGIMVQSDEAVNVKDMVSVVGSVRTNKTNEKYIYAYSVDTVPDDYYEIDALGMNLRACSQNLPEGLLVQCFGKVDFIADGDNPAYFYLNDGSPIPDGSGHTGIKVLLNGAPAPLGTNTFVCVTGIRTRDMLDTVSIPAIKVRTSDDIRYDL